MSNETQKPAAKPDGNSVGAMRSWIIIAVVVALFFTFYKTNPGEPAVHELTQTEFYKALEEGKIVEPVVRFLDRDEGVTYLTGEMETDKVDKDGKPLADKNGDPVRVNYRVPLVPGENESLMEDLFRQQIEVKVRERRSPLSPLVMNILFFGGMMFLFYWFFYRKMGGTGGPFGFGKSKARLLNEDKSKKKITFKDVAGLYGAKEEVMEIVDFLKNPKKYTALGGKIPKGALLVGPPGTGKTLLAKAVAGEANVPFFSISGSDFVEMFVGVGASRVRDLFRQAKEKAPCIVFIDEIDAVGRARAKNGGFSSNDERENTLNQLLTEMDGFGTNSGVIVLAATNRADILDQALMRAGRFDRQIHVELPELKEREEIFQVHLRGIKVDPDFNVEFMAKHTPGFSGADIANVCNEAALTAARRNHETVSQQDFLDAVDRIIGGLERKNNTIMSPAEKRTTAYHEAGHALVGWLLPYADPVFKVSIIPRGNALGLTWYLPEERKNWSRSVMIDRMCALLGGRVAEEILNGEPSTGALNDLERMTGMAYSMVQYYGMSDKVGNLSFYDSTGARGYNLVKPYSEKTAELMDEEVKAIVQEVHDRTFDIIESHKDAFMKMGALLLEKEVIFAEDIEELLGPKVKPAGEDQPEPEKTEKSEDSLEHE